MSKIEQLEKHIKDLERRLCCIGNETTFYDAFVDFPVVGIENRLYIDSSTGGTYIWDGAAYVTPSNATVSDVAYDPITWDANTDGATKNAIRDKIDTMDTAIGLNTAKVTNATHSGDATGDGLLTAQPALITGKAAATVATGDLVLIADINDSNNLKQVTAQSIAELSTGLTVTTVTKTLTTGAWSLVLGLYEQDVADAAITAAAVVDMIPNNADIATVKTAEILPRTESGSGTVKVFSTNLPGANIGVTLNIYK